MKKYKIGEFAKEMGVSQDLIKHYEKYGILEPDKDQNSRYRYFSIQEGEKIIQSKKYRNLGFTIKESADLISHSGIEEIQDKMRRKSAEIREKIHRMNSDLMQIEEIIRVGDHFREGNRHWQIVDLPGFYFIKQTENRDFVQDTLVKEQIRHWLEFLPITCQALLLPMQSLEQKGDFRFNFGLSIRADFASQFAFDLSGATLSLPRGKYLCLSFLKDTPDRIGREMFRPVLEMTRRFDLCYGANILCNDIVKSYENGSRVTHYLAYIPVLET